MHHTSDAAGASARAPDGEQYVYVDTARGGVDRRNKPQNLLNVRFAGLTECYVSHNRATDTLVTWVAEHKNNDGNPTVAGFDGSTWADNLHLDFDAEGDVERARGYLLATLTRLESWGVDLSALCIYYSGNKGFHVEIPHTLFGGFTPSKEFHKRLRRAAKAILGDITFDTSVYDKLRLWRVENTRNAKTRLFKIRLTVAEARTLPLLDIYELAGRQRDTSSIAELTPVDDDEWMANETLVQIWDETITDDDSDQDSPERRQADPTDTALDSQTTAAIAASWPHSSTNKTEGETSKEQVSRHADYLLPVVGALMRRGCSADRAVSIISAAAISANDQSFLTGRDWKSEIERIAFGADERLRGSGPVKGFPALAEHFPALAKVIDVLWPALTFNLDEEFRASDHDATDSDETPQEAVERPVIKTTGRDPKDVAEDAIRALRKVNLAQPRLFVRGGAMTRTLRTETGRPIIETLSKDALFQNLCAVATWERYDARSKKWAPASPPDDVVRYISGLGVYPFPPLVGISEAPFIRPDGTIVTTPGYDPSTRLVYRPAATLSVPPIPDTITSKDVRAARALLGELIGDFSFDCEASLANAVALLMTLAVRPAINGPAPFAVIDKNTPGAGATLLTEVYGLVVHGRAPGLTVIPDQDTELEKRITTLLRDGEPFNVFDNVDRPLEHGSLAAVLTATEWAGRILGKSETARYPNLATWTANGNNIVLRGDIARRSYRIRLIAEDSQPWRSDGKSESRFRHPNLTAWASKRRGDLLAALLILARHWFAQGQPAPSTPRLGKFEEWSRVVGGILEAAEIPGFLANLDELYDNVDAEASEWEAFLTAWFGVYGSSERSPSEIKSNLMSDEYAALTASLPGDLAAALGDPRQQGGFDRRLGKALSKRVDRRYGEQRLHLVRAGSSGRTRWKVLTGAAR